MNCDTAKECLAKSLPEVPCWETAGELKDYRHILDICRDCVVYLLKGENSSLSRQEMEGIMEHKANCILA